MPAAFSSLILHLFRTRPDEFRRALLAFIYLFASVGAFVIGRIARSVLFLEIPDYKEQLPLTYLGVAAAVSVVMYGYARVERKLRRDQTNLITLACLIAVTLAFRIALVRPTHAVYWTYFIWVEVFGTFLIVQFWSITSELFHSRQAKRLFAFIGGGGVLGSIMVGFGVKATVQYIGTENLLLVTCGYMAVAMAMVFMIGREARAELLTALEMAPMRGGDRASLGKAADAHGTFSTRHVKCIAAVVVLTYFASTMVDYQFNVIVAEFIEGKQARSEFFGLFYGVTGALGGVVQFFITAWLLQRFGVLLALLLLPCSMLAGSLGIAAVPFMAILPALGAVSFTKGAEAVLRYTVNDSTLQLLYLPVPVRVRGRAKAFIDGILKPLSIGGAGLVLAMLMGQMERLLGWRLPFTLTVYELSWLVGAALTGWLVFLLVLRKEYLKCLVQTLQRRRLNLADSTFNISDETTLKTMQSAFASEKIGDVLNALDLLTFVAEKFRQQISNSVVGLLEHDSTDIRVAALKYLRTSATLRGDEVADLLTDPSHEVRAAAVLTYCALCGDYAIEAARPLLADNEPRVRAAAIAGLIGYGGLDGIMACVDVLKSMLNSDDEGDRVQAAWVLGEIGVQNFYQPLVPLLRDPAFRVRQMAIAAAGKLRTPALIEPLVEQLGREAVSAAAVNALASFGEGVESAVSAALSDEQRSADQRAQACRVLARIGSTAAVDLLLAHLEDRQIHVRSAAVAALRAISIRLPGRRLDTARLTAVLHSETRSWYELLAIQEDLQPGANTVPLLYDALTHRLNLCQHRILGILSLLHPNQPIEVVSSNLKSSVAAMRANAVEVLDNLLAKAEKTLTIPIFDDGPADKKLETATPVLDLKRMRREARLAELLDSNDRWLRVCAATAVGHWNIARLAPKVRNLLLAGDDAVARETAVFVLRQILAPDELRQHVEPLLDDPAPAVRRYVQFILAAVPA